MFVMIPNCAIKYEKTDLQLVMLYRFLYRFQSEGHQFDTVMGVQDWNIS